MDEKDQPQSIQQQELRLQLNEVEKKLADVKARWPYHSVQPKMVVEREDLEEERDRIIHLLNNCI